MSVLVAFGIHSLKEMLNLTDHKQIIKIGLAICLLIPILDPPYGFYQFLRIGVTTGLAYFIYKPDKHKFSKPLIAFYVVGCILFQPFEKITFEKDIWLGIDVVFALVILTDLFLNLKTKSHE